MGLAVGYAVLVWLGPVYEADALLDVRAQTRMQTFEGKGISSDSGLGRGGAVANHANRIKSRAVATRVAERLMLEREISEKMLSQFRGGTGTSAKSLAGLIQGELATKESGNLVVVTFRSSDSVLAALVLNTLCEDYVDMLVGEIREQNRILVEDMTGLLDELSGRERLYESQMQTLLDATPHVTDAEEPLDSSVTAMLAAKVSSEQSLLSSCESQLGGLRNLERNPLGQGAIGVLNGNPALSGVFQRMMDNRIAFEKAATRYGPRHPTLIALDKARAEAAAQFSVMCGEFILQLEGRVSRQREVVAAAKLELEETRARLIASTTARQQYVTLVRSLAQCREQRRGMLATLNAAKARDLTLEAPVVLIRRAEPPSFPVEPKPWLLLGAGGLCGVLLAAGLLVFAEWRRPRHLDLTDLSFIKGLPLLGSLPVAAGMDDWQRATLYSSGNDHSFKERVDGIWTSLSALPDSPGNVWLVSSSQPGEGKSFVVSNLAQCAASHGHRVLLLDADMRRPRVHYCLDLPNAPGLLQVLQEGMPPPAVIRRDVAGGIDVMTTGGRSSEGNELLQRDTFKYLVQELSDNYDLVLIDAPPFGVVSETITLPSVASSVIFVCGLNRLDRRLVGRRLGSLLRMGTRVAGVVFNHSRSEDESILRIRRGFFKKAATESSDHDETHQ